MLRAPSRSQCFSTLCQHFQFWVSEVWTVAGHRSGCCPAYAGASKQLEIVPILCVDAVDVECKRMERLPWTSASHVLFSWFFASNIWILVKYPLNSRARMAWNCDWSQIARQSFTSYWFIGLLCFSCHFCAFIFSVSHTHSVHQTQCSKSWKLLTDCLVLWDNLHSFTLYAFVHYMDDLLSVDARCHGLWRRRHSTRTWGADRTAHCRGRIAGAASSVARNMSTKLTKKCKICGNRCVIQWYVIILHVFPYLIRFFEAFSSSITSKHKKFFVSKRCVYRKI